MLFVDNHNCVVFGGLYFWPERGLIHCEDSRTNGYKSMSVKEAMERTRAISDMCARSRASSRHVFMDPHTTTVHQRFVQEMIRICEVARAQGEPHDDAAAKELAARRPKTFVLSDVSL